MQPVYAQAQNRHWEIGTEIDTICKKGIGRIDMYSSRNDFCDGYYLNELELVPGEKSMQRKTVKTVRTRPGTKLALNRPAFLKTNMKIYSNLIRNAFGGSWGQLGSDTEKASEDRFVQPSRALLLEIICDKQTAKDAA